MTPDRVIRHRAFTRRDLEIGLAASLAVCLLLGLLPIRVERRAGRELRSAEPLVLLTELPVPPHTRQPAAALSPGARPPRPDVVISAPSDTPLSDVPYEDVLSASDAAVAGSLTAPSPSGARGGVSAAPRTGAGTPPRQILEVLPELGDGCDGAVTVLLSIGRDGRVRSHRIRRNTLGEGHCLRRVLTAMYASRWEEFGDHDHRDSVIVRKTYARE